MRLEIPVSEGEQYRVGELKFEGLTVLKEPFVRNYFKLQPGDVYNDAKFKKAYEKLRDVYGSLGYFQWTGGTQRKPDPEKQGRRHHRRAWRRTSSTSSAASASPATTRRATR